MRCRGQVDGKDCGHILSPEVKVCPECGTENENNQTFNCSACATALRPGDRFCPGCGRKVKHGELAVRLQICTGKNEDGSPCGNELTLDLIYCPKCGARVPETATPPAGKSLPKKDVSPDAVGSDRFTESHREGQSDLTCSPCKKFCWPDPVSGNYSNVGNVEQLYEKDQPGAGEEIPSDARTVDDITRSSSRGNGAKLSTESRSGTTSDTATSDATPNTATSSATPDTAASGATPDTATSNATPDTALSGATPDTALSGATPDMATSNATPDTALSGATPDMALGGATPDTATNATSDTDSSGATPDTYTSSTTPETDPPRIHTTNQRGVSSDESDHLCTNQASAPVPCTDDEDHGEGANSGDSSWTQHSRNKGEKNC